MQQSKRLYDQFKPEHYALTFDLTNKQNDHVFYVTTIITGEKMTEEPLRLHARDLEIRHLNIDGEPIEDFKIEDDEIVINTRRTGKLVVFIDAKGVATDSMHGIYPCYYDLDGKKQEMFATQFESHYAREAFPCVDEPEAKAEFSVTIVAAEGKTVLSNMPVEDFEPFVDEAGWVHTVFKKTPRMSSYLLAFVVGDLQRTTVTTNSGVEVNVYATLAHSPDTLIYACDWAKRSIEFFESYFDIKYPLPKCDQVALPDFSASAMENWGLVTYREAALLVDAKHATTESKQHVSTVISHEISHQWFGNLVTMKWWNDLWLNESFANLMEYIACDALEPSWNIWDEFSANECLVALKRDSFEGVQSVKMDVSSPGEIEALFDHAIVYAKGSRLLRMLHDFVGDEAFRYGLRAYFQRFAYSNTTENDLWNALSSVSGKDISTFMSTWLTRPGYPVVTFSGNSISQERFFIGKHSYDDTFWTIPLLPNADSFPKILESSKMDVDNNLIILNMADGAHFVTHYDDDQFKSILNAISHEALDSVDIIRIINEQLMLAISGRVDITRLLSLLESVHKHKNPTVWKSATNIFNVIKVLVEDDEVGGPLLRQFAHHIATEQHARLGWKEYSKEPEINSRLRPYILSLIGYTLTPSVIKFAKASYSSAPFDELNPNTRVPSVRIIVHEGIEDIDFKELLELYQTASSAELKQDLIAVLTATRDPEQIDRLIDALTDSSIVRPQDIRRWLPYLLSSPATRDKTWHWIREKWSWIMKIFKGDTSFDAFPTLAGRYLTTKEHLAEYKEFFSPWSFETSLKRAIALGEKELSANVDFAKRNYDLLIKALEKQETK